MTNCELSCGKCQVNPHMTLNMDWREIKIESAHVVPIVKSLDKSKLNDSTVRDYLNWSFKLILPWVHNYHPENVAFFNLPKKFPPLLEIHHIKLEIRDNYLNFGLFPWFFTSGLVVQSVQPDYTPMVRSSKAASIVKSARNGEKFAPKFRAGKPAYR